MANLERSDRNTADSNDRPNTARFREEDPNDGYVIKSFRGDDEDEDEGEPVSTGGKMRTKRKRTTRKKRRTIRKHSGRKHSGRKHSGRKHSGGKHSGRKHTRH